MEPSEELLRGIAHDLNNLLGAILNYSTLLSRQITDPLALADVAQIRNAAERAATLSLTLLTFEPMNPRPYRPTSPIEGARCLNRPCPRCVLLVDDHRMFVEIRRAYSREEEELRCSESRRPVPMPSQKPPS